MRCNMTMSFYPQKIQIRCSSLPRILNCSHSLRLPTSTIPDQYALIGTQHHQRIYHCLKTNSHPEEDIAPYVNFLRTFSNKNMHLEEEFEVVYKNYSLIGHPDCWFYTKNTLYVIDYKSGYQIVNPTSDQLQGYALLILRSGKVRKVKRVKLIIFQQGNPMSIIVRPHIIFKLKKRINDALKDWRYALGEHCQFCPSKFFCKQLQDTLKLPQLAKTEQVHLEKHRSIYTRLLRENHDYLLSTYPNEFEKRGVTKIRYVYRG